MVSKYSHEETSYKITLNLNINSQFPAFPVIEKREFVLWEYFQYCIPLLHKVYNDYTLSNGMKYFKGA